MDIELRLDGKGNIGVCLPGLQRPEVRRTEEMKLHRVDPMEGSDIRVSSLTMSPMSSDGICCTTSCATAKGNEDLYLAALDRAEAGTPELNWANHYVWPEMYPDGRVVIDAARSTCSKTTRRTTRRRR
jgi:hypothetical protein